MFDHSHLSAGNSLSASSHDLYAEYGVSPSDMDGSHSPETVMGESSLNPLPLAPSSDALSNDDMQESSPFPSPAPAPLPLLSDEDSASESANMDFGDAQLLGHPDPESTQDIFKAAHHFATNDRLAVVEERKKNQILMSFLTAKGFSARDIQLFQCPGSMARVVDDLDRIVPATPGPQLVVDSPSEVAGFSNAHKVLDSIPQPAAESGPSPALPAASQPPTSSTEALLPPPCKGPAPSIAVAAPSGAEPVVPATSGKSWSAVVSGGSAGPNTPPFKLDFIPPPLTSAPDGSVTIKPPLDFFKDSSKRWSTCLVGGFVSSRLPFKLVAESAHKMWDKLGLTDIFLQEKGFFVFKFSTVDARDNILALGPWFISNKQIILKLWREGIDFRTEISTKSPVWVKFHHVPMTYWSPTGLSLLASAIGRPLTADPQTSKLIPMTFARMCIEMDSSSSFPPTVGLTVLDEVGGQERIVDVAVEYQSKPQVCSHCKHFGHSALKCSQANYKWIPKPPTGLVISSNPSGDFGKPGNTTALTSSDPPAPAAWTTVTSRKRTPNSAMDPSPVPDPSTAYLPVGCLLSPSPTEDAESPSPPTHPLVRKLKHVDEMAARESITKVGAAVLDPLPPPSIASSSGLSKLGSTSPALGQQPSASKKAKRKKGKGSGGALPPH